MATDHTIVAATSQTKIQKLITDVSSPYFIHSGDHPRTPLVDEVLTCTNYASWSRDVRIALCAKNKLGFIDGTFSCPDEADIKALWTRVATMVLSWLLNSIDSSIKPSLTTCNTPHELWEEINLHFTQGNSATIYQTQRDISMLRQGNDDVTTYYNKFKILWGVLDVHVIQKNSGMHEFLKNGSINS